MLLCFRELEARRGAAKSRKGITPEEDVKGKEKDKKEKGLNKSRHRSFSSRTREEGGEKKLYLFSTL